jgi:hypothetical protein
MPDLIEIKEFVFDVDSYENNFSYSSFDVVRDAIAKVEEILKTTDTSKIISNTNLSCIITNNYRLRPSYIKPQIVGKFSNIDVFIDPKIKDNKILFYNIKEPEIIQSEIDPYGEEDWGNEDVKETLIYTLNIKDTKGRLT